MVIREMKIEDVQFFNEIRNECVDYLHDKTKYSIQDNINWFNKTKPKYFVIELNDEIAGYFRTSNWDVNSLYIGMDLHPKYRGKGLAMPLYELFFVKLIQEYNIKKVYLEVLTSNKRAINIYNKLDFTIIDLLPHDNNDKSVKMEKVF